MTVLAWLLDSDPALRWQVLRDLAEQAAAALDLPLRVVPTGHSGLERALRELLVEVLHS